MRDCPWQRLITRRYNLVLLALSFCLSFCPSFSFPLSPDVIKSPCPSRSVQLSLASYSSHNLSSIPSLSRHYAIIRSHCHPTIVIAPLSHLHRFLSATYIIKNIYIYINSIFILVQGYPVSSITGGVMQCDPYKSPNDIPIA